MGRLFESSSPLSGMALSVIAITAAPMLLLFMIMRSSYGKALNQVQAFSPDVAGMVARAAGEAELMGLVLLLCMCGVIVFNGVVFSGALMQKVLKAEKEREEAWTASVESNRLAALGRLSAGVAHEINTPLATMIQEAAWAEEVIQETPDFAGSENGKEVLRALSQIQRQGERCKEITSGLLRFARRETPQNQPLCLNTLVREVAEMLRKEARNRKVDLRLSLMPDLPPIKAVASRIQQLVLNLSNNAMDALQDIPPDSRTPLLEIGTRTQDNEVVLTVADNGPGIPGGNIRRIYDPFFTTKPVGKGTGLGLSICHGIAAEAGATIAIKTMEGMGTVFAVRFPMIPEPRTARHQEPSPAPHQSEESGLSRA